MTAIARHLEQEGYTLRSGAAEGADKAFELGVINDRNKNIYLPWSRFNGHRSLLTPSKQAFELASKFHPRWSFLTRGSKCLHARNCHQVLGKDLNDPVDFIICWTKEGRGQGGTGMAIRIAKGRNIKVYDLAIPAHKNYWIDRIRIK